MSSDNSFDNFGQGSIHENILPEIKAFANNSDTLDGVLDHLNGIQMPNGNQQLNTSAQLKTNPFAINRDKMHAFNDLKGMELSKSFPLSSKIHSFTGNAINYDALRDTSDHDIFKASNTLGFAGETAAEKIEKPEKPAVAIDLFKDAAAAAFNELGGTKGNKVRKHEFYNKISEQAFATVEKVTKLRLH